MPTPKKGPRLGGSASHQRHILANLATALFEHGKITTTESRARTLRPVAEKLITFAKRGDVAARRQVLTVVKDKAVVHTLFADIAPRFALVISFSATGRSTRARASVVVIRPCSNSAVARFETISFWCAGLPPRRGPFLGVGIVNSQSLRPCQVPG